MECELSHSECSALSGLITTAKNYKISLEADKKRYKGTELAERSEKTIRYINALVPNGTKIGEKCGCLKKLPTTFGI